MAYDSRPETYEHIEKVRGYLLGAATNLLRRAHEHDLSKLREPELATFDEFTPKLKDLVYGSDEYRECLRQMKPALEHHYAHNPHHPEYHEAGIRGMSLLDLIEMLCDWYAASQRTRQEEGADFGRSIALNADRFGYDRELGAILANTARELGMIG
jgi:hypothetical protein